MAAIDPLETLSNAIDGIESGTRCTAASPSTASAHVRRRQRDPAADAARRTRPAPLPRCEARVRPRRRDEDRRYLRARHITADKLQGVDDLLPDNVLAKITTELVPDSKGIRAVLHKLNFYGPGGHFARHRDTPRAESQFGSLVVSLPAAFEGGQLLVSHEGDRTTCDWGRVHSKDIAATTGPLWQVRPRRRPATRQAPRNGAPIAYFADAERVRP